MLNNGPSSLPTDYEEEHQPTPRVVSLISGRTDKEIAADLKKRIADKLVELCGLLNEATDAGFQVAYGTGPSPMGQQIVTQVVIAKHF